MATNSGFAKPVELGPVALFSSAILGNGRSVFRQTDHPLTSYVMTHNNVQRNSHLLSFSCVQSTLLSTRDTLFC